MAHAQSSMIIKQLPSFGGQFIDSQYLAHSYETGKPYVFQNTLSRIFSASSRFFTGKMLQGMTAAKAGGTMEIDQEVYRWPLQGAETKSARILENLESSNVAPGLNGTTFRLKLDLDYYQFPEVLMPEDNNYPIAIVDGPTPDGTGYVYICKLQGDNPANFLPPAMLEVGREFSKAWTSTASEYNSSFGGTQYANSLMLESQVGAFAQKYDVTD